MRALKKMGGRQVEIRSVRFFIIAFMPSFDGILLQVDIKTGFETA